jgi:hypothetical protein
VYRRRFRFRTSASATDPCTSQSSTDPSLIADRSPGIAAIAQMKITSAELRTAGVGELTQANGEILSESGEAWESKSYPLQAARRFGPADAEINVEE